MQISTEENGDLLEMRIAGRLDNEWASHLNDVIDDAVRQGSHSIVLDLTEVSYLSSAGIGALIRAHKQFQAIRGFFGVGVAPPHVEEVIRLTGLSKMLLCDIEQVRRANSGGGFHSTMQPMFRVASDSGLSFELYDLDRGAVLSCEVVGDANRFPTQGYRQQDCRALDFASDTIGIGLGAFGRSFAECSGRMGEFLAVGGAVAQQPTSGAGKPDYQLEQGKLVPQVQVGYGLRCRGGFRQLQRFEPATDEFRVPLSALVERSLSLSESDLAGIVMVAETSGLIGAALRRSPVEHEGSQPKLAHPEIRRWLSFSPERSHAHTLALIVGVASRGDPSQGIAAELSPLLRRLGPHSEIYGHFHAAVFSYRPFKKRKLELTETVGALFDSENLQAVMHLLHDDREITGGGESEFLRGACWLSPITHVSGGTTK